MRSTCIGAALIGLGISLMASLVIGTPLFLALFILITFALLLIVECASLSPGRTDARRTHWRGVRRFGRGIFLK